MDRGAVLLQGLKNKLQAWIGYIQRSTYATEVVFEPRELGAFALAVRWKDGQYVKEFSREFVFGGTYALTPLAWAVEKRACDHARDIVREVLGQRGAL